MTAKPVVPQQGWRSGFVNLLRKELSLWWGTGRWVKQVVVWAAIVNGLLAMVSFAIRKEDPSQPLLMVQAQLFFGLSGMATAVGAIIAGQDALIGERQSGTAQWVLSKPTARSAFVLAKLLAISLSFLFLAVIVQGAGAFLQMALWGGELPHPGPFVAAVGLLCLHALFYITLVLMLGTLILSRGPLLGIAFGFLGAGLVLPNFWPKSILIFPWKLPDMGAALVLGSQSFSDMLSPTLATIAWSVLFVLVALWRFEREEL